MEDNHKMTTLSECMNMLREEGYAKQFEVKNGKLCCPECEKNFNPQEIKITEYYRFEGESDPADSQILYAIESNNGEKGIVVNGYGAYSNEDTAQFIQKVSEIHKSDNH